MQKRRYLLSALMIILVASSLAIINYLVRANFYTNSNLLWIGATAGFLGCLFLAFAFILCLTIVKGITAKKNRLILLLLTLALGFTVFYLFKGPFNLDSDIWWYGAIAGFLSCATSVFLVLASYIAYKLIKKNSAI
jgi:hypothetical protein